MPQKSETVQFRFNTFPIPIETVKRYTRQQSRSVALGKKNRLAAYLISGITWICLKLSWKAAYELGTLLGLALYHLRIRRHVAMVNLDIVYGASKTKQEKEIIFKASMLNLGRLVFTYIRLPHQPPSFWKKNVRTVNLALATDAFKEGRGVIALAAHLGIIDLSPGYLGQTGYPVAVVGKRIKSPVLDKFILDSRLAVNIGTIRHRNSMKRILYGIKRGEMIVLALDQNMQRKQGAFLNWMGRPASSMYASGYLVQKLKVPVVAGYCWQKTPEQFELVITERVPFHPYPQDPQKEMLMNAQAHADAVQRMILKRPEIWFWIHKRWRIQPDGVQDPYARP